MTESKKALEIKCEICKEIRLKQCTHTEEQRALIDYWTTEEVKIALTKGYKILEINHVVTFKDRSNSLYKNYLTDFIAMKLGVDPPSTNQA